MGDRIRRMNAKQVEKILKKYGFELISQKGSHKKWRNSERNLQVTVPYHQEQLISQTAFNIPQVGRSVPASWKRVLDAIRERSETDAWISYEQFLALCAEEQMELCELSYKVELPEADAQPTNLMAQLVPSKRPDEWEQDWVLKTGDTEQTQICRILDATTGRTAEAEGLMYRLIVRFHRYSLGKKNYYKSRHWKNGMLLDDGFNGRAFIEEIDGDIYVKVRAAYPSWFLAHLCSEITGLVKSFWKGLDPKLYIPCPRVSKTPGYAH